MARSSRIAGLDAFGLDFTAEELAGAMPDILEQCQDAGLNFELLLDAVDQTTTGKMSELVLRKCEPIGIEEFMFERYFLGLEREGVWPMVLETIQNVNSGPYVEAILTGAIGIGKTTIAQVLNAYSLYVLSCYTNPQALFGLMPHTHIVIAMMNRTFDLAKKVTFGEFKLMLEQSPYFTRDFAPNPLITSYLAFPNHIHVLPAQADSNKLLGMAVIGGTVDEANFMEMVAKSAKAQGESFDQAQRTYRSIVRRRKSRFLRKGKLPGVLCIVSSKNTADDFTERRIRELQGEEAKHLTYIYDKPQWAVVPPDRFSGETFRVEIGGERKNSRVLKDTDTPREGVKVLDVPVEFKDEFTTDLDGALRDLAGEAVRSTNPFFYDIEKALEAVPAWAALNNPMPFTVEEWDFTQGDIPPQVKTYQVLMPERHRACHIDLGLTSDAAGLSVGYVRGLKLIRRLNKETGKVFVEQMPIVAYDLCLRIPPPPNAEIEFEYVRGIVYHLRDERGIPIRWVTLDGFQSVDTRQQLRKAGFKTGYLSVEGVDPYTNFREAFMQGRILAPPHSTLFDEIGKLVKTLTPGGKPKVDHPPSSSKDVADSACGVYTQLLRQRASWKAADVIAQEEKGTGEDEDMPGVTEQSNESDTDEPSSRISEEERAAYRAAGFRIPGATPPPAPPKRGRRSVERRSVKRR